MSLNNEDIARIGRFRGFFERIKELKPGSQEHMDHVNITLENIKALEFRPLLCIDWVEMRERVLKTLEMFLNDMWVESKVNELLKDIDSFHFLVYVKDTSDALFSIMPLGAIDLTECEKEVLSKILQPEDDF